MSRTSHFILSSALLLLVCGCQGEGTDPLGGTNEVEGAERQIERGRYLAAIMDCAGCHNKGSFGPNPQEGPLQGGTIGFEVPGLGVFYPPNLTPHAETGLGRWTDQEIADAVRRGRRPDGRELAPAMPWPAYAALTDEDARALAAYLKSLPPSDNQVPAPGPKERAPRPYMTVVPGAEASRETGR